jgi:hypothetical protein
MKYCSGSLEIRLYVVIGGEVASLYQGDKGFVTELHEP